MAMGDPANEPGNPDGCKISKKKISNLSSSLTNLADMFSRAATLIETAVSSIASSVRKVGKGTGKSGGGGGGVKDTITTPEEFNRSVKRIKKAQEKKEKAAAQEIYEANMASMKAEIDAREEEEKEIINAAMRGLSARNAIRLSAEAEENNAQKKEAEARKKHHENISKQQEKSTNEQMKQLESFQKRQAAEIEKYRKAEEKEVSDDQKEIIKNAKRLLSALNKATRKAWKEAEAAAKQAEKEASNEADRQEKEIIDNSIRLLGTLNRATRNAWKEAEAEAKREENEIIRNAMRGLSARNAIRDRAEKEAEKAAQEEENEIIRNAMRGLSARNAIRQASEKEMEARKKFFEDQERDIMRQAPIAYSIGKALGFVTGSILKIGSSIAPEISKSAKGLFSKKEVAQEEMTPKESASLEGKYLSYEAVSKREERTKRKNIIDPLAIKEQQYNERKGVSKPPRKKFAKGGKAESGRDAKPRGTDTVPAMLTPGEFVVNKKSAQKNHGILKSINDGTQYYAAGGYVGAMGLGSSIAPEISKSAKGLFSKKEVAQEEMTPKESASLEGKYLSYEAVSKREERTKRKNIIDPLAIKEQQYNERKGVSKPPRKKFAKGGKAESGRDAKPRGTDTVPAMLTPGEFVVNKKSAQKNRGILKSINDGTQYYAAGGYVGAMGRGVDTARRGAGAAISGASAGFESAGLSSLISGLQKLNGVVGTAATGFRTVSAAVTGGLQAFNGVVGAAATGFKVLAASALAPVDMFNKLVGFAGSFVEAVNPALMQQLSLAFKDLQAVIGMGLQPIIAAAIPIIRAFADKLQPVMQALMPTFDQLAQSMISLSGPVITLLIEAFAALEPVIALISSAIEIWAGILTAVAPIISTVFKEIVYRITSLGTTLQWLVGKIMSWIPGTGDAGKKMMASAEASQRSADAYYAGTSKVQQAVKAEVKPGAAAGAAAKSASFSGISDFGKNLMQQAFSSSTQAAALKTAEYSEKTYTELTKMNAQMGRANPAAPAAGVRRGAA